MTDSFLASAEFEQIQVVRDPAIGLLGFVAIHDTRLGPAFGGTRRSTYSGAQAALADALRLAEHMTWKCALHEVPGGGGKAVIVDSPELDRRAAYRRLAEFVEEMGGRFYTGPDVGTEPDDLFAMAEVTEYVALPDERGPGDLTEPTAIGVFAGLRAVAKELDFSGLEGVHVVLQGLGGVGWRVGAMLHEAGARLTVTDVRRDLVAAAASEWGATITEPDAAHAVDCDIFSPCALGGVVRPETIPDLGAKAIAGSANNVLADAACGEELWKRGLLYAPDFVINSGALVHGALFHLEEAAPDRARIEAIGDLLTKLFFDATVADAPPERIALQLAQERLRAASADMFFPKRPVDR